MKKFTIFFENFFLKFKLDFIRSEHKHKETEQTDTNTQACLK